MSSSSLYALASQCLDRCRAQGVMLATAESCTGGMIISALTEVPGSSEVVDRGFVTYSNAAKMRMLGVPEDLIEQHGAVSEPVARAMAEGALDHSLASLAVSCTGIAGPGGGSTHKPVGTVHIACARKGGDITHHCHVFSGDRHAVRLATTEVALQMLISAVSS